MQQTIATASKIKALIPSVQYAVTMARKKAFEEPLNQLEAQLSKCPKLGKTNRMEEHPAMFHYFCGGTDIYICEFDGEDILFGYTILNGDLHNSEWGYTSLSELTSISVMNIDYYFKEQSIEAALYRSYPDYFKKPASLEK
jgi:hypothetical protein